MIEIAVLPPYLKRIRGIVPRINDFSRDRCLLEHILIHVRRAGEVVVPPLAENVVVRRRRRNGIGVRAELVERPSNPSAYFRKLVSVCTFA